MTFLTDFADQAVMVPLMLAVAITLLAQGWRRGAAAWVVVVCATSGITLGLKLLFIPCSDAFDMPTLHTPSGHVAAATVVVGGLAVLLLGRGLALDRTFGRSAGYRSSGPTEGLRSANRQGGPKGG
jgi:membrane-associated phospholipid phosphatase